MTGTNGGYYLRGYLTASLPGSKPHAGTGQPETTRETDYQPGPLDDLRIADFSRVLAGPYRTMLPEDPGAPMLKVEIPAKDDTWLWIPAKRNGVATYYLAIKLLPPAPGQDNEQLRTWPSQSPHIN